MANKYGDVIKVPSTSSVAEVKPSDIIASYAKLTQKGVTILSGTGVLVGGTALGRVTASKKYVAYDDDGTDDGRRVCLGILRETVDATSADALGNIIVSGILKYSKLTGLDANGITDLNGRKDEVNDLFSF